MSNKKSTYSYFIHDIHEYMSNLPPRAPAPRAAHQRQLCVCSCVTQALSVFSIARFPSGGSHFWGLFWGGLVSGKEDFGFWLLFFVIIGGNRRTAIGSTVEGTASATVEPSRLLLLTTSSKKHAPTVHAQTGHV